MEAAKARAARATRTRSRPGASRRRGTRRASTSAPTSSSSSGATREFADGTFSQEGPVHRPPPDQEGGGHEPAEPEKGGEDVVAPLDHPSRPGGAHLRGAQRAQIHPRLRHREHGGPQARRVRSHPHLPRPHRRQEGSEARRPRRTAGHPRGPDARCRPDRAGAEVTETRHGSQGIPPVSPNHPAQGARGGGPHPGQKRQRRAGAARLRGEARGGAAGQAIAQRRRQRRAVREGPVARRRPAHRERADGRPGTLLAALHAAGHGPGVQGSEEDKPHPTDALGRDAEEETELSMGQKVNPIGFRLGVIRSWDSKWYEEKNYARWLHEDIRLREYVKKKLGQAGISKVEIERAASKVKVNVHTARPGIVIGKRGAGIESIKKELQQFTQNEVFLNIVEVRKAETDAQLVAENITTQLERRIAFRRAMKKAIQTAQKFGAMGIRVACSGRLGGAEMARYEWHREGRVPLHTLRADIDYGFAEARTTYGKIGCKVWIFRGEVLPEGVTAAPEKGAPPARPSRPLPPRASQSAPTLVQ